MDRAQAVRWLINNPAKFGHLVGFGKLGDLHNEWIKEMIRGDGDSTLQAHRGSYKTTCVSIALALLVILRPNDKILFLRKTDTDVKEVIAQVKTILQRPQTAVFVNAIYGVTLRFDRSNATEITTNLTNDARGTSQLVGMGIGSSLTGKHFDRIFTDDIVNLSDRLSKADRDKTKIVYQELQNVKNRGGRIFNTGTPWHKEDAFALMPNIRRFDCYATGLISAEELQSIKGSMEGSLFAANYQLRHIASDDVIFTDAITGADAALAEQGICHIDASYGGEDYTAFTIARHYNGKYYLFGRLWHKHIDDVEQEIINLRKRFNAGKIYCENNADKGYLAKSLKAKGERVLTYHEDMNKFFKITSYLKGVWSDVEFVAGTDADYVNQICDYNEHAAHDDAPDSAASIIRILNRKRANEDYKSIYMR